LLELLVVLAIVGLASTGVGLALRDGTQGRLEREALRLGALLEAARAHSQALGVPLRWQATAAGFFLSAPTPWPLRADCPVTPGWMQTPRQRDGALADIACLSGRMAEEAQVLLLGPDPIIAPQALTLSLPVEPQQQVQLATDGVRPFAVPDQP
jgi:general secretion pathway protein H